MPAAIITPMLIGAAVGAVSAAVTGGNILKGALFGAIGGAIGGAFTGAGSSAASSTAASTVGGEAIGVTTAAEAAAGQAAVESALAPNLVGGEVAASAASGAMNNPSAFTALEPSGMMGNNPSAFTAGTPSATTGFAPDLASTGMNQGAGNYSGIAPTPQSTGVSAPVTNTGLSATPSAAPKSFLDNLLDKGSGMMNNRTFVDAAGRVISGYAQGQNQQAMIDARQKQIEEGRANARFGNVGSRYNTAGMMGPATYKA